MCRVIVATVWLKQVEVDILRVLVRHVLIQVLVRGLSVLSWQQALFGAILLGS